MPVPSPANHAELRALSESEVEASLANYYLMECDCVRVSSTLRCLPYAQNHLRREHSRLSSAR